MPVLRQTSFSGGELAPTLWGRSDLAKYATGLKRARNFFIGRHGSAYSRPGTVYVNTVKTSSDGRVRLIPFVYSNTASYVLEFGHNYIRFYKNGAVIGSPFEVTTTYATADLPKLKYAQQGAVMTLTHPSYPPAELVWSGTDTGWALADISFAATFPGIGGVDCLEAPYLYAPLPIVPETWVIGTTYAAGSIVKYGTAGIGSDLAFRYFTSIQDSNVGINPTSNAAASLWWVENTTQIPMPWQWAYTGIVQLPSGEMVETSPLYVTASVLPPSGTPTALPLMIPCYPNQPAYIHYSSSVSGGGAGQGTTNNPLWGLRFYKGLQAPGSLGFSGQMGLIGAIALSGPATSSQITGVFTDNGIVPDYTQAPPQGLNPFSATGRQQIFHLTSWTPSTTDYPSCVGFFEQRRIFAGTPSRPEFLLCSASDDFYNFDDQALLAANSAIFFGLASRKMEEIRGLVSVGPKLLAATAASVWSVGGSNGPLAFNDIDAKRQGEVGSSWVDPLVVDGSLLIIRSKGTGIRALTEDFIRQTFVDSDLSVYATHLFSNHTVVDWAYAEDPWGLVWAVRDDGVLLSCSYLKEQEVLAWSWHDSPGTVGADGFEQVCTVPEGTEDAVYLVTRRTVNGSVVRYIERMASRLEPVTGGFLPPPPVGVRVLISTDCSKEQINFPSPSATVTGLTFLVGETVYAVADGSVQGPFTVSNAGTITLAAPATYVTVGLPYTPELQLLNASMAAAEIKTTEKIVNRIGFEVDSSRGLMVGPDFNHLTEWEQRTVQDAYGIVPAESSLVRQYVLGNWGTDGDACIRQTLPLPVTLISVAREVAFGDPP